MTVVFDTVDHGNIKILCSFLALFISTLVHNTVCYLLNDRCTVIFGKNGINMSEFENSCSQLSYTHSGDNKKGSSRWHVFFLVCTQMSSHRDQIISRAHLVL